MWVEKRIGIGELNSFNPLTTNPPKWPNRLKQFVCLSV